MSVLPMQSLRVVALEQAVAAPFCSRQLADMGADVIKSVNFAIQNEREWSRFCNAVLYLPLLEHDERFATNAQRLKNRNELEVLIEQQFAPLRVDEVIKRLDDAEIANGAVNDVQAVANHAQLAGRGRWMEVSSPNGMLPALLPPHNLMGVFPLMGDVPALGEHTEHVLTELGEHE